ncbi:MAG: permease-like cell division protein FtsX [Clostridia bacterium]|nr:permease-like cell division protein FtsX [Clostridia bacterium]
MKYNVISYFLSEGFRNVFKNKKSTFSCLGVMCATMFIFGLFFAISQNINNMVEEVKDAQAIRIFALNEATQEEIDTLGKQISEIQGVNTITPKTSQDAYNEMREGLGDKQEVMDSMDPTKFSASFIVTLTDLDLNESVQESILKLDNVKRITSSNQTISTLSKVGKWIKILTGALLGILIIISIFIISNTIKLTVHARRKEISIMKYVGATNSFIRTPFIIEGVIIGLASSVISLGIIGILYNAVVSKLMASDTIQTIGVSILSFNNLFTEIVAVYLILGIGIGILGSSISMRKYLEV